jgi:hypothetical protein
MTGVLAAVYAWRPHCTAAGHVLACRLAGRVVAFDCPRPKPGYPQ